MNSRLTHKLVALLQAMLSGSWMGLILAMVPLAASCQSRSGELLHLTSGWELQSSAKVSEDGALVSSDRYNPGDWYNVTVPTTVVAAMVKAGVYPNPDFGMNLRQFPGMSYSIGTNFSTRPMAADSPFAVPWWYRKTFEIPPSDQGKTIWLNFEGINYRANIWLNGKLVADTLHVAGAWRHYEFNVTGAVRPEARNVLAVEVFPPNEHDLGITFVDWNPSPPDKEMGIFQEVYLATSGPVALRFPAVISEINSPANDRAQLTVTAQVINATAEPIEGVLQGRIGDITISQTVKLAARESKEVIFPPADYAQLQINHPRLWWPTQMGSPELYKLQVQFQIHEKVSDETESHFGIRQITSEVQEPTRRLFRINGEPLLIRGAGWAPDFMLRWNKERLNQELDYVADMRLNTIRLEGRPMPLNFYEETDRRGILVMAGWSCCDAWEKWAKWSSEDHEIASASLRSEILRLRGHPSLLMWLNGSDNPPPDDVEAAYLDIEKELRWPNPILSSATSKPTTLHPENGVRMTGPYDYVPPTYWYADAEPNQKGHDCDPGGCGGAHGFNTETSAGPAVPPIESLEVMLGKDHLWPIDSTWRFHAGGAAFADLTHFTNALTQRYGAPSSAEDYAAKSQLMTYEGVRAMFEAYSKCKYVSTGVIQWMLNNAWPSTIWHLYDYYLRPGGGYFGAKIAMEPLHPIYSPLDRTIWVVSSQYKNAPRLTLQAKVYNLDMTAKYATSVEVDAAADSTRQAITLPQIDGLSSTYFLKLSLQNAEGEQVGSNFYWLSTTQDQIDWSKSNWYYSPTRVNSDFTALNTLPKVRIQTTVITVEAGDEEVTHVTLRNPSKSIAFFIRLKLDKSPKGQEILPVLWEDNYISLLPGESRKITARYARRDAGDGYPALEIRGWNVD